MTLAELAAAAGAALVDGDEATVVDGPVTTDSRECGPGSLYVARRGEHADGHDFAPAAVEAGAVAVLGERPVPGVPTLVSEDVQTAFGRVARAVVDRAPGLTVLAVTGSSGKTTVKDLLAAALATSGPTVAPVNSLNGEIGVPLTVCRVDPATRFLVAEMGARGVGHISYLTRIAPPQVAIVLNVGLAHVGEFGSVETIALAKAELPGSLPPDGLAVLNRDDARVAAMADGLSCRVVTVGEHEEADLRAVDVRLDARGRAAYTLARAGEPGVPVSLAQPGRHQVSNSLAVLAAATEVGVPLTQAVEMLATTGPASRWRMEVTDRADGVTVVNDAYNANPDSVRAALRALADMEVAGRRVAVLGGMLELGDASAAQHRAIGAAAAAAGVDVLLGVGELARDVVAGFEADADADGAATWVPDTDAAFTHLESVLRAGDAVLLKSSRDAGLRWLGDRLSGQGEGPTR